MNRPRIYLAFAIVSLVLLMLSASLPSEARTMSADAKAIRALVDSAYFNGAFNKLDTKAMSKGFHKDFAIFSARGDELSRYEIETWIQGIEKRKAAADFDASKSKMDCKIVALDVTGGSASAKIELYRGGKLIYTDYLSFLKFTDGWKIAAKVYHKHS